MADDNRECFAIMPISDPEGYEKGHFSRVYEDLVRPAAECAGFAPSRADETKQTNVIHVDILQRLLNAPMAVCDLSSRNPNVLFELGIRQSFGKPVVLIQEVGTPKIFDITPLRTIDYSRAMGYRDVRDSQAQIAEYLKTTFEASESGSDSSSLVKILSLQSPATIPSLGEDKRELLEISVIRDEISEMRRSLHELSSALSFVVSASKSDSLHRSRKVSDRVAVDAALTRIEDRLIIWMESSNSLSAKTSYSRLRDMYAEASAVVDVCVDADHRERAMVLTSRIGSMLQDVKGITPPDRAG